MRIKTTALAATTAALMLAAIVGPMAPAAAQEAAPGASAGAPDETAATVHRRYRAPRAARGSVERPLTVRREAPPPFLQPGPGRAFAGPAAVVAAPVVAASEAVGIPFRMLSTIFPASGDLGQNPLGLIGAPIQAAGQIAQLPFTLIEAPLRSAEPATF